LCVRPRALLAHDTIGLGHAVLPRSIHVPFSRCSILNMPARACTLSQNNQ
jgi:hypothetical protein